MRTLLAVGLLGASVASHAEGFYAGGSIGWTTYPNYTQDLVNSFAFSATQTLVSPYTVGVQAGQWVNDYFGWEIGYTDLGSVNGSYTWVGGSGNYTYSASAAHGAIQGGIPMGRGKLFGKLGVFSATTTLNDTFTGGSATQSVSSSGLLFGIGFALSFSHHLSGNIGVTALNGVKFADVSTFGAPPYSVGTKNMVRTAIGVNYMF